MKGKLELHKNARQDQLSVRAMQRRKSTARGPIWGSSAMERQRMRVTNGNCCRLPPNQDDDQVQRKRASGSI